MRSEPGHFDVVPANRELAGAEIDLVELEQRDLRLKVALAQVADDYDFILIDCPPTLNLLTVNAFAAAQAVLIPMQCEYYALEGLTDLVATIKKVKQQLNPGIEIEGLLRVMFDPRNTLAQQVSDQSSSILATRFSTPSSRAMCGWPRHPATACRAVPTTASARARKPIWNWRRNCSRAEGHDRRPDAREKTMAKPERTGARARRPAGRRGQCRPPQGDLRMMNVSQLKPGKYQPRTHMDETSLEELADSIRAQGLMQPILAREVAGGYEIIAGERRWRAAQLAGLNDVPVLVARSPDDAVAAMALIENIQREDLNAIDEAQGLQRLIHEFGMTHDAAAQAVGKSRAAVSNLLRLLNLSHPVQDMLTAGLIEMGHARALLPLACERTTRIGA